MQRTRWALFGLFLVIALALGVLCGVLLPRLTEFQFPALRSRNAATLLRYVHAQAQTVAVKYVIEKALMLEDTHWPAGSQAVLIANGVVRAAVDLTQVQLDDLEVQSAKVRITLPSAILTEVTLDEEKTRVLDRAAGTVRRLEKDLTEAARQKAVEAISRAARSNGILREADESARNQLRLMFTHLGFSEVEFVSP